MCHVKIGFQSTDLRRSSSGHYIYYTLEHVCGFSTDPLHQLSEKLSCLTKRTPRTLGDVFGFIWHLNGQLFRDKRPTLTDLIGKFDAAFELRGSLTSEFQTNRHSAIGKLWNMIAKLNRGSSRSSATVLSLSLKTMVPAIPFLYQLFMAEDPNTLPGTLFDLTQHCHKYGNTGVTHNDSSGTSIPHHQCSEPADLWSLYYPVYSDTQHTACRNKNCGGYLEPLTLNYGATFSPSAAPAYLSWMAYLTDDFYEWLSEMHAEFINISCDHCTPKCFCTNGRHATSGSGCNCPSVVQCGGVLPLLYHHGLQFMDAKTLNGGQSGQNKKTWQNFHSQLSNVLAENAPLHNLLLAIDEFLYLFRFYFFYNLSSFWLCTLAILLYLIFYSIDVLHFKSHVHFPSSHSIPPLALLTTGKVPALTKLTYYMP